jgi:adenosylcobinamide kinase/adenosylcobinamide-phosphate guanylyltransferase
MSVTLITGGARSGKSRFAAELATRTGGNVLFVATATAGDTEMVERIRRHRAERPAAWTTLEVSHNIGAALESRAGDFQAVIIDCLTLLTANLFGPNTGSNGEFIDAQKVEGDCSAEIDALLCYLKKSKAHFIIVTNEVGEGIVPLNRLSRIYRDVLGKMNQKVAREATTVYLMVAGIPLRVKPAPGEGR